MPMPEASVITPSAMPGQSRVSRTEGEKVPLSSTRSRMVPRAAVPSARM